MRCYAAVRMYCIIWGPGVCFVCFVCLGTLAVQMPTPEDRLPRFFFLLLLLFFVWSPGLPPALSDCPGRDYRAYMGVQPAVVVLVVVVVSLSMVTVGEERTSLRGGGAIRRRAGAGAGAVRGGPSVSQSSVREAR